MSILPIIAIAQADFRERVRRYSFFVTLMSAVFLAYATATGKIQIKLGAYRGVYTSAWIGAMVALVTTTFASLIGFYIVKNTVERDRITGVGQILATTPLSKAAYILGKFLSNFLVLAAMVLVLALAAVVMATFAREDSTFDWWALLSPFFLIALPAMALTAAMAVLFEVLPGLRGGVGNVLWFFVWSVGVALPLATKIPWLDPSGLWTVSQSMMAAARAVIPGFTNSFSLTIGDSTAQLVRSLRWTGLEWTSAQILWRLAWPGIAVAIALLAALMFDRFDPAGSKQPKSQKNQVPQASSSVGIPATMHVHEARTDLTPLTRDSYSFSFLRLVVGELHLALKGYRWWWYAVAIGLIIAQLASPLEIGRGPLLAAAWIWPIFAWSAMGTRESRYGTSGLIFSSARILERQFPASIVAGLILAALSGFGVAIRLLIAGHYLALLAWVAGVLFIPSLAVACGTWAGTSKTFEALYTVLWYVGPLKQLPGVDYSGTANSQHLAFYTVFYFLLAAVLLAASFARRAAQLRYA